MLGSLLIALSTAAASVHSLNAGELPACSNRVINDVVKRAGCTVGDSRCWYSRGGFCTDYVEKRILAAHAAKAMQLTSIQPEQVRAGDLAVYNSRAHYAYVEAVVKDASGRPIGVNLSEFNFGTCWVDRESMVTERYKVLNKRTGVALQDVDGGFMRPVPAAR